MIAHPYTFLDFSDILERTWTLWDQDILSLGLIAGVSILVCALFFIILPLTIRIVEKRRQNKEKQKKKHLLTEILLKKEIEDEVEKEVEIDARITD